MEGWRDAYRVLVEIGYLWERCWCEGSSRMGTHGLDCSGSLYGQVVGGCECGNEPRGAIRCRKFLD
jgi:hypothetical protein